MSISRLAAKRETQNLKNLRNSSLWTCWHIMDMLRNQNKNGNFGLIVSLEFNRKWSNPSQ